MGFHFVGEVLSRNVFFAVVFFKMCLEELSGLDIESEGFLVVPGFFFAGCEFQVL